MKSTLGLIVLFAALTLGCASTPQQTSLMRRTPEVVATATELRIRIRVYAHRYAHVVEDAADQILSGSTDPAVRMAALEWKTKSISQAQTSCYHSDPMAALFDTWALAVQQRVFFETPEYCRRFGEWRSVALAASKQIESEVRDIVQGIKRDGDLSASQTYVEEWAKAHPVKGDFLRRRSMLDKLAEALAAENLGAMARLGRLSEDMSDLAMRASLLNEMLPKQVRWQTELVMYDMGLPEIQDTALETLPRAMDLAERGVVVAESMPQLVRAERKAILEATHEEIARPLHKITEERTAILAAVDLHLERMTQLVSAERQAVLAGVHDETTRVIELVREEREVILAGMNEMVAKQWAQMRQDIPEMMGDTAAEARGTLEDVIDHTMMRVAFLGTGGMLLGFVLGVAFVRLTRRKPE